MVNMAPMPETFCDSSAVGKKEPLPIENPGSSETPGVSSPLARLKVHVEYVEKSLQSWEEQAELAYVPWEEQLYSYPRSLAAPPQ